VAGRVTVISSLRCDVFFFMLFYVLTYRIIYLLVLKLVLDIPFCRPTCWLTPERNPSAVLNARIPMRVRAVWNGTWELIRAKNPSAVPSVANSSADGWHTRITCSPRTWAEKRCRSSPRRNGSRAPTRAAPRNFPTDRDWRFIWGDTRVGILQAGLRDRKPVFCYLFWGCGATAGNISIHGAGAGYFIWKEPEPVGWKFLSGAVAENFASSEREQVKIAWLRNGSWRHIKFNRVCIKIKTSYDGYFHPLLTGPIFWRTKICTKLGCFGGNGQHGKIFFIVDLIPASPSSCCFIVLQARDRMSVPKLAATRSIRQWVSSTTMPSPMMGRCFSVRTAPTPIGCQ